jgi:hypothetical protein
VQHQLGEQPLAHLSRYTVQRETGARGLRECSRGVSRAERDGERPSKVLLLDDHPHQISCREIIVQQENLAYGCAVARLSLERYTGIKVCLSDKAGSHTERAEEWDTGECGLGHW